MLWTIDAASSDKTPETQLTAGPPDRPAAPPLPEYTTDRRRRMEYELLGFVVDHHPMALYEEQLARWRIVRAPEMSAHVGRMVLMAGMLTTAKPVHTAKDEPMEFATFDDGHGLVETVLFPDVYRRRGHVLFDQGPFLLRGKVEEEFGASTLTVLDIQRVDRLGRSELGRSRAKRIRTDVPASDV
jgi:DNA polymerase III alpha subunit